MANIVVDEWMNEEKRTLIETFLPVDEISEEAKKEKNARAPTFEMHYWWTRKPLITARAAVLGALLPADFDPQEFEKLLGLEYVKSTGKRAFNYDITLERMEQLQAEYKKVWGNVPIVLDPFAGGGSIPFESMRLGIDVIANDYNAMAFLILKATLEYPQKYGEPFYKEVEKGFQLIFEETKEEMEQYYPRFEEKEIAAYIWAWQVKCTQCGFENPIVGQWWLARKKDKNIYLDYKKPSSDDIVLNFSIRKGDTPPQGNSSNGNGVCLKCGSQISNKFVIKDIKERESEQLLVLIVKDKNGKSYELPTEEQIDVIKRIESIVKKNLEQWVFDGTIPDEEIPEDTRGSLSARLYLPKWRALLNPRQLLLFITIEKKIKKYCENLKSNDYEYKLAVATYLSFLFGKHILYNNRSITWHRTKEIISQPYANRGVGITWDHAEVNPFVKGSGTLSSMSKGILEGLSFSQKTLSHRGNAIVSNESVLQLNNKVPLIITDPPYFDDVRYAEFSEIFYIWERRTLKQIQDPGKIQVTEEMSVGGWGRTPEFFKKLFYLSCKKMNELLLDNGILLMFFAHSSIDAWDFVINSLQKSGFHITATWPVHTESTNNPLAAGHASILSSIIIVARKRMSDKSGYIEEIQDEVRAHLLKRLDEFWNYGLRGADLTVSSMGATLDVITQYSEIKSYTGEMQIKDVLELVQKYVAQYVLSRFVKNASDLDPATSFYLYTRLSRLEGLPFDTANLIAKSMNVDLKLFEKQGLIETSKKGKAQGIKILNFSTRETNSKQSLIDCVQFVMNTFGKGGYTEVERELASIPFSRNEIKDVLEALLSLPTEDPERQVAQKILERMGQSFPKRGQMGLDNF